MESFLKLELQFKQRCQSWPHRKDVSTKMLAWEYLLAWEYRGNIQTGGITAKTLVADRRISMGRDVRTEVTSKGRRV